MMIDYGKTEKGDVLRVVPPGASGTYELGELVRVVEVRPAGVLVENQYFKRCEFVFNCGAARLEPTEWKNDFPEKALEKEKPPNL